MVMTPTHRLDQTGLAAIVEAARRGDELAWAALHTRFDPMMRAVARSCRLAPHDVDDATQAAWVKLYEHVDRLRDPCAVAGWLAKTAHRESLALLQRRVREHPTDEPALAAADERDEPEALVLQRERRGALTRALASLPQRERRLMTLIATDARYEQISATLDMPLGSIGPFRSRSLSRLQRHPELRSLASAG
jgi:RNA polymerase sigma factor (sigma-70 family)